MHTTYVYAAKNGLRTEERSCEFIARAPLCPMRARVHVNLRPASRSHESVLSSSSSDSRSAVDDDASSRASRSESPLPRALSLSLSCFPIPSSTRPSSPPVAPPAPRFALSFSLFHSSSPNKRWIQLNRRSRSSRSSHTENGRISRISHDKLNKTGLSSL